MFFIYSDKLCSIINKYIFKRTTEIKFLLLNKNIPKELIYIILSFTYYPHELFGRRLYNYDILYRNIFRNYYSILLNQYCSNCGEFYCICI